MTTTMTDYDDIVRVVRLYIEGFGGSVEKFKEAFHEDAWMFFLDATGTFHKRLLANCFEEWAMANQKVNLRVMSVLQMGDAAGVVLGCGDDWVDFHSLLRIDGVWKIMNKTATHSSRSR